MAPSKIGIIELYVVSDVKRHFMYENACQRWQ